MNIKVIRKMQQRLEDLEVKAATLKDQIIDLESFKNVKVKLEREQLQSELTDTLNRIKHINAANKNF